MAAAERDARILALRGVGQPIDAIAGQLGCSSRTVRRVVARRLLELNASIRLEAESLRAGQLLELQTLRQRLAPVLAASDPAQRIGAVRAWLGVLERESRLCGLDAPTQIDLHARNEAAQALLEHLSGRLPETVMQQVLAALSEADGAI